MNQRAHPTVRPYALALGVLPRRGITDQLAFLGPSLAADLATALLLDTLGALSTFPVRHRLVFTDGADPITTHARLPATWRELPQRGTSCVDRTHGALDDLIALGAEAMLLVTADGPMLPLGQMFDGMMWLLPKKRVLVGAAEGGGLYALGTAERLPFLTEADFPQGLGGDAPISTRGEASQIEDAVAKKSEANGLDVQRLPHSYRIEGPQGLRRLRKEVAEGMFAPHCRKLFERPDIAPHVG
ncbi:MAG: hypothetical protein HOW73_07145 [Polyangiaceae bacterium]|nr:hypothetical protein [Polyangiaceae bacterium]